MITHYYYMIVPQPQPPPPSSKAADRRQLDQAGAWTWQERRRKQREGRRWDLESDVLEDDLLDVAADGGCGGDGLAEVELVERGGLAGVVEPHDDDLVLLRREHQEPHPRHPRPHLLPLCLLLKQPRKHRIWISRRGGWRLAVDGSPREEVDCEFGGSDRRWGWRRKNKRRSDLEEERWEGNWGVDIRAKLSSLMASRGGFGLGLLWALGCGSRDMASEPE